MKLQISTACQGHGRCYTLAPQLLDSDDEGFVTIRGGDPIEVPDDLRHSPKSSWVPVRRAPSA